MLHFKCKDHIINKKNLPPDDFNLQTYNQDKVQSWVQSSPSDFKSCDFCSQSFESLDDLADHMVEDHQDDKPEEPNNENQNDSSNEIVSPSHAAGDHPNVQDHSQEKIDETPNAAAAAETDIDSDQNKTQCYYCAQMVDLSEIQKHMITAHSFYVDKMHGPARSFRCYKCEKTFDTPSAMGIHNCIASKGMYLSGLFVYLSFFLKKYFLPF